MRSNAATEVTNRGRSIGCKQEAFQLQAATRVGSHSEKRGAAANFKRGFGFHPMPAFVDHGAGGTGELC
jgi:hypothetical protein